MTPYKQLFRHDPDNGVIGDCWRTCFACLLDMEPAHVPHFVFGHWDDAQASTKLARAWLAQRGFGFIEYPMNCDLADLLSSVAAINPGMHYMLSGTSSNGTGHSVIACDDGIVHDPAQDNSGIVGPMSDGFYWVSFLVPSIILNNLN